MLFIFCCSGFHQDTVFFFPGKVEELPRKPLGQEMPVVLSPVQPSGGKPSAAGALSLHIITHQPDSISPDQSPSKDPRDLEAFDAEEPPPPLPSPEPVLIHSQATPSPDGCPLAGPPPYRPPGGQDAAPVGERLQHTPLPEEQSQNQAEAGGTAVPEAGVTQGIAVHTLQVSDPGRAPGGMARTLSEESAPEGQSTAEPSSLPRSGSPSEADRAEADGCEAQLPEQQAASLPTDTAAQSGGGGAELT